jgi:hypothetical protein
LQHKPGSRSHQGSAKPNIGVRASSTKAVRSGKPCLRARQKQGLLWQQQVIV